MRHSSELRNTGPLPKFLPDASVKYMHATGLGFIKLTIHRRFSRSQSYDSSENILHTKNVVYKVSRDGLRRNLRYVVLCVNPDPRQNIRPVQSKQTRTLHSFAVILPVVVVPAP